MHKKVFEEFETICRPRNISGCVLEIGATPDASSLLNMKSLAHVQEKVGINIQGPSAYADFAIYQGNANAMDNFSGNRFDAVLCNATFEHDKFFWKTLEEIKRVLKPGGLLVIGAPGFTVLPYERYLHAFCSQIPFFSRALRHSALAAATLTLQVHNHPGDYYRFSPQAFGEVFFEGMREVTIHTVLNPPRIIGAGIKPL